MRKSIVDRFFGEGGRRRLKEAWATQAIVNGDLTLAGRLSAVSNLETHQAGSAIVEQSGADTDVYLILVGLVQIEVNGRCGPIRAAGTHFGELSLIDVRARRSATVRAIEETVVARISESDFSAVADDYSMLWRGLAIEIARRLRQRLEDVPMKNNKPFVFIGSSQEGLEVANVIKSGIADEHTDVRVWTEGVFGASETTIESLERTVRNSDIAILVFTSDDQLRSRGQIHSAPRDNVILELGLFIGALGRSRAFVVVPRGSSSAVATITRNWKARLFAHRKNSPKIPTDLLGMTVLNYAYGDLQVCLAPVCEQLKRYIMRLGPK